MTEVLVKYPPQYKKSIEDFITAHEDQVLCQGVALKHLEKMRMDKDLSKSSQRLLAASLKWYYKHILGQSIKLPMPYRKRGIPTVIGIQTIKGIFDSLPKRYLLMFKLMYGAGMKVCDLTALRIKDIDINNGGFLLSKNRKIQIPFAVFEDIQEHMRNRQKQYSIDRANETCFIISSRGRLNADFEEQPFFASRKRTLIDSYHRGRSFIDPSTLHVLIKSAAKCTTTNRQVTTMSLRHSFAVDSLANKCNIVKLAAILGQQDIRMTLNYLKLMPLDQLKGINLLDSLQEEQMNPLQEQIKIALRQPDKSQLDKCLKLFKEQKDEHFKIIQNKADWQRWTQRAESKKVNFKMDVIHGPADYIFLDTTHFHQGNPLIHISTLAKALNIECKKLILYMLPGRKIKTRYQDALPCQRRE